jgi:hypothetical protein
MNRRSFEEKHLEQTKYKYLLVEHETSNLVLEKALLYRLLTDTSFDHP